MKNVPVRKVISLNTELLKENRCHGDILFPLGFYTMDYKEPASFLDCHWHDEMEFLYMEYGEALLQIGDRKVKVKSGQAIFIHGGEMHSGRSLQEPWGFSAIVFHPALLNSNPYDQIQVGYINPLLKSQHALPTHIRGDEAWEKELLHQLKKTFELAGKKEYTYEMLIKSQLYVVFSILLQHAEPDKEHRYSGRANQLKAAIQHMQMNYHRPIHIRELSAIVNMSEGHFCRYFKKIVMKTPIDYLNDYRIMKASYQLQNTDRKIIDIALEVGFNNLSYFINRFKKTMGVTPARYRKLEK